MATNLTINGASGFKIKRPPITTSGFVSDVDATIKSQLDELNALLGKRVFPRDVPADEVVADANFRDEHPFQDERDAHQRKGRGGKHAMPKGVAEPDLDIEEFLALPLTPKKVPENDWAIGSIARGLSRLDELDDHLTLSEHIDVTAGLSALKYSFRSDISAGWYSLGYNVRAVLDGYAAITDYLIAYAYYIMGLRDVNGLKNFVLNNSLGAKNVANYAIVSASRAIVDKKQLQVPDVNNDESDIVKTIKDKNLSLSAITFAKNVQAVIDNSIFNAHEAQIIDGANIGKLPPGIKPMLIQYIKQSPVPITNENARYFLPLFVSQISGTAYAAERMEVDVAESDRDFDVQFLEDDQNLIQVSASAVKCAAQLYYGMVLGDELDVFDVVNYFTHKFLIRGGMEIRDRRLRDDLQMYVFSNKFSDLKTKKVVDRTRPAERQMFYRQVFNQGTAEVTDDVIVNREFPRLWKVLMLETVKYIEQAQASPHPANFVSPQNIMQAVEDLQYNLSTHTTGMANVITPLIYAELDFVVRRIFMHDEVRRQIVPAGGTWWRVVETLYMGMRNMRPKATVLYNKAKLGHSIIRSVAEYNPAAFEDDKVFSEFVSKVDAFITTQSIIQESLTDELREGEEEEEEENRSNGSRGLVPAGTAPGAKAGNDDWDF